MAKFFQPLRELLQFFVDLDENTIIFDVVQGDSDLRAEILNLNRIDQLFKQGIDSENRLIGVYSTRTQEINPSKVAGTPFNFLDEGIFFKSFMLVPFEDFIEIIANPFRDGTNLFLKYTPKIVGLTPENEDKLPQIFLPLIQEYIKFKKP